MTAIKIPWKMICCNTVDAVINNNLEHPDLFIYGYRGAYDIIEKYRNSTILYNSFYITIAEEIGWHTWFNTTVSKYTGYKINDDIWEDYVVNMIYSEVNKQPSESFKYFQYELDVTVVDEVKFSLSLLSQDLRFNDLINSGYTQANAGCRNITPRLVKYIMDEISEDTDV